MVPYYRYSREYPPNPISITKAAILGGEDQCPGSSYHVPIVSIVVPFFGLTKYIIKIL